MPTSRIVYEIPATNVGILQQSRRGGSASGGPTSGHGHVIPDTVLLVNGIPLVVAEFKSSGSQYFFDCLFASLIPGELLPPVASPATEQ